jgi:hypothetical protein
LLTDRRRRKFQCARNFNVSDFQPIDRNLSHVERPQSAFAEKQPPNRESTYRQSAQAQGSRLQMPPARMRQAPRPKPRKLLIF